MIDERFKRSLCQLADAALQRNICFSVELNPEMWGMYFYRPWGNGIQQLFSLQILDESFKVSPKIDSFFVNVYGGRGYRQPAKPAKSFGQIRAAVQHLTQLLLRVDMP